VVVGSCCAVVQAGIAKRIDVWQMPICRWFQAN
jgi:hypothetical protein